LIDIPHRFVPSMIKFVDPVSISPQTGHASAIHAMAFCPLAEHLASLDVDRWLKVWKLESMELISSSRVASLGEVVWLDQLSLKVYNESGIIAQFNYAAKQEAEEAPQDAGYNLYLIDSLSAEKTESGLRISIGEEQWEHELADLFDYCIDPIERFVALASPNLVEIIDCQSRASIVTFPAQDASPWKGIWLSSHGDLLLAFSQNGKVFAFDPMRPKPTLLVEIIDGFASFTVYQDHLLALANKLGNILIYDLRKRAIAFKTARKLPGFKYMFPSPQKLGFIALREESVSAYLFSSQEIQPASPLPSPVACACAGELYVEIIAAFYDNKVYRLKLDSNDIEVLSSFPETPRIIAYAGDMLIAYAENMGFVFFDGEQNIKLKIEAKTQASALALHEKGRYFASYHDNQRLAIYRIAEHEIIADIAVERASALVFGRGKSANSLFILDQDLLVWKYDTESHEISVFQNLSECVPNGIAITMSIAERGFAHVLIQGEQEQYYVLKLGLNTAKCSEAMRVLCIGQQIVGALFEGNRLYLRKDATSLRIVRDMQTFIPSDWARSEPLAIF